MPCWNADAQKQVADYQAIQTRYDQLIPALIPLSQMVDSVVVRNEVRDYPGAPPPPLFCVTSIKPAERERMSTDPARLTRPALIKTAAAGGHYPVRPAAADLHHGRVMPIDRYWRLSARTLIRVPISRFTSSWGLINR